MFALQAFTELAEALTATVVAERFMAVADKSIKPVDVGGIAGMCVHCLHPSAFIFPLNLTFQLCPTSPPLMP